MNKSYRVIPIFIPERACPHRCIYCNQFSIAGQSVVPSAEQIPSIIDTHLSTMPSQAHKRIAFFGGSFTGMPIDEQNAYLRAVQPYLNDGSVSEIQLSTRPDYINHEILENLKHYGVKLIELGAQSLHDDTLQSSGRGHTVQQVEDAAELILANNFKLGLQMMIGLPGDTKERALLTAQKIHDFGASYTRIYPTLVVQNTRLAHLYKQGKYVPLSLEQAVDWTKSLYLYFTQHNITILRIGLHPSEGLLSGTDYLAGPFHVSFKELVLTAIWHDRIKDALLKNNDKPLILDVPAKEINYAVGYQSANKREFPNVQFRVIK